MSESKPLISAVHRDYDSLHADDSQFGIQNRISEIAALAQSEITGDPLFSEDHLDTWGEEEQDEEHGRSPSPTRHASQISVGRGAMLHPAGPAQSKSMWGYLQRTVPLFGWLPSYRCGKFARDFVAGTTLSLFLIPQGLAYSSLAHLPTVNGLFVCIFPAMMYAMFGGSRQMSVGPESVSAMLLGSFTLKVASSEGIEPTQENLMGVSFILLLMEGIILTLLGMSRQGFLDCVLIRGVMTGMIMAVGIGIMISQTATLLGFPKCDPAVLICPTDTPFSKAMYTVNNLDSISYPTAIVSLCTLTALVFFNFIKTQIEKRSVMMSLVLPPNLIVVAAALLVSYYADLQSMGVKCLGSVTVAIGGPVLPPFAVGKIFSVISSGIVPSAVMAIILFTQSSVIGKQYASKHSYTISSNGELVALGLANITAAVFNTLPACGSFPRSKVNDMAGATSPMAGMLSSLFVLAAVLFCMPALYYLPACVMAALVFYACSKFIIDPIRGMFFLFQLESYRDITLLLSMCIITLMFGISQSIFFAFGICLLLLVRTSNLPIVQQLGLVPSSRKSSRYDGRLVDIAKNPEAIAIPGWLMLGVFGKIHFANCGRLKEIFAAIDLVAARDNKPHEVIFLDLRGVPSCDSSSVEVMGGMIQSYLDRQIKVILVRNNPTHLKKLIVLSRIEDLVGAGNVYNSVDDALAEISSQRTSSYGSPIKASAY